MKLRNREKLESMGRPAQEVQKLLDAVLDGLAEMLNDRVSVSESFLSEIACRELEDVDSDAPGTEWNNETVRRNMRWFIEELSYRLD